MYSPELTITGVSPSVTCISQISVCPHVQFEYQVFRRKEKDGRTFSKKAQTGLSPFQGMAKRLTLNYRDHGFKSICSSKQRNGFLTKINMWRLLKFQRTQVCIFNFWVLLQVDCTTYKLMNWVFQTTSHEWIVDQTEFLTEESRI